VAAEVAVVVVVAAVGATAAVVVVEHISLRCRCIQLHTFGCGPQSLRETMSS
jgi:hypothetical protein